MLKSRVFTVAAVLLFSLLLGGCFTGKASVGVVDKEKIARESKEYAAIVALREEISSINAVLDKKRQEFNKELAARDAEANKRIESEWTAGMQARQDTLAAAMENKNKAFVDGKNAELKDYSVSLEKELVEKIKLLEQEAVATSTTSERHVAINKEISALEQAARAKVVAKKDSIQKEVDDKIAPDRRQIRQELDSYGAILREELFKAEEEKSRLYMEEIFGEDQKNLNAKQKQIQERGRAFEDNTNKAVEKVAREKQLVSVFYAYTAGAKAIDITDEVLKELNK